MRSESRASQRVRSQGGHFEAHFAPPTYPHFPCLSLIPAANSFDFPLGILSVSHFAPA